MTDFGADLGEAANCLKIQLISMKFGHSSHNLGNYMHKLKKVSFSILDPSTDGENDIPMKHTK